MHGLILDSMASCDDVFFLYLSFGTPPPDPSACLRDMVSKCLATFMSIAIITSHEEEGVRYCSNGLRS